MATNQPTNQLPMRDLPTNMAANQLTNQPAKMATNQYGYQPTNDRQRLTTESCLILVLFIMQLLCNVLFDFIIAYQRQKGLPLGSADLPY